MAPVDDRPGAVSPKRSATPTFGLTSLVMATIAVVSAVGAFGAVRTWFPGLRAATSVPSSVKPKAAEPVLR